mmetsp:Transcript_26082/g.68565  ORF Transcript_26082/g.68565 Transcript_26082/m.68565 type:complete len:175 (-) Transcript_26082:244-768(-)
MFNCRMCSENMLHWWLSGGQQAPSEKHRSSRTGSRRNEKSFACRSEEETRLLIKQWEQYAHPRAKEFFDTPEKLEHVLLELCKGIDKNDDPIVGPSDTCVYWYGDVTKDDTQAAMRMVKPGESSEAVTFVNRVLAFIFSTDESFEKLMALPKEPFKMNCGDQLCVHLAHISIAV